MEQFILKKEWFYWYQMLSFILIMFELRVLCRYKVVYLNVCGVFIQVKF